MAPSCRIYRLDVPPVIEDEALQDLLKRLPAWRLEKALSYKFPLDRFLCAQAFCLLAEGLEWDFGIKGPLQFGYSPLGKPFLAGHPEIHFNISHCRRCICCAVSDRPVGIDVEEAQFDPEFARAVLSPQELERVLDSDSPQMEFAVLWTLKESFLKMTGEGVKDDMKEVLRGAVADFRTERYPEGGYAISVAMLHSDSSQILL